MPDPQSRVPALVPIPFAAGFGARTFSFSQRRPIFFVWITFWVYVRTIAQATFRISHNSCISLHHKKYAYFQTNDIIIVLPVYNIIIKLWLIVCLDERELLRCVKWYNMKDLYKKYSHRPHKELHWGTNMNTGVTQSNKTMWVSDMFYSTPCSCKCIFIFVRIDIHAYIGGYNAWMPSDIGPEIAHYAG